MPPRWMRISGAFWPINFLVADKIMQAILQPEEEYNQCQRKEVLKFRI